MQGILFVFFSTFFVLLSTATKKHLQMYPLFYIFFSLTNLYHTIFETWGCCRAADPAVYLSMDGSDRI